MAEPSGDLSEPDSEPTPIVERFGRYELVLELASGGMASVYLARLASDGDVARMVAVKRIHPHLAKAAGFTEMFLDEARISARIDHPNVCQVLEHGRENGVSFIAMEFLAGESLQRVIGRLAARPDASTSRAMMVATIVAEAADGLHAAHELLDPSGARLDVVHRDVSPHNIFVTFDGAVKVVDFGIASAANQVHHTETGTIKGKFAYMAPEQLGGARADRRVDVWALGVVLWEVLTLKRLFRRESPSEVVRAVESEPVVRPSEARPGLPDALDAIVLKALARDPSERYATAKELARDLRAVVRASGEPVDRAAMADWMAQLFPSGDAQRRAWLARAAEARNESGERLAAPRPSNDTPATAVTRAERPLRAAPSPASPSSRRTMGGAMLGVVATLVLGASFYVAFQSPSDAEPPPVAIDSAPSPAPVPPSAPASVVVAPIALDPVASDPPDAPAVDARPRPAHPPGPAHHPSRRPPLPAEAAPIAVPTPADDREGCFTIGGGITVTVDGARYDGPRARCLSVAPGPHQITVANASSGEPLYDQLVTVAPGARVPITRAGVR